MEKLVIQSNYLVTGGSKIGPTDIEITRDRTQQAPPFTRLVFISENEFTAKSEKQGSIAGLADLGISGGPKDLSTNADKYLYGESE